MSLSKIPLSFAFSLCFARSAQPPNPPPAKDDLRISPSTFIDNPLYLSYTPRIATKFQWLAGIAEIATILAWNFPSSSLSKAILSLLVLKTGRPGELCLSPITTIGGCMMITGTLIRVMSYRHLGKFFRTEPSIQENHQLVTSGPYSIVRHPSYTGFLLTNPGWFLWHFGNGSWVRESGLWNTIVGKFIVLSFGIVVMIGSLYLSLRRMSREDEVLRELFGKKWDQWASRVRYQVVPGIW